MTVGIDLKNLWLYGKGIGAFTINLLHDLADSELYKDIRIQLYAPSFEMAELNFLQGNDRFTLIPTYAFNKQNRVSKLYYDQIGLLKYLNRHKPDILFSPYFDLPLGWRKEIVATVHDLSILEKRESYSRAFYSYYQLLLRKAVFHSSNIVTVSEYSAGKIKAAFHLPEDKVRIMYNKAPKQFLEYKKDPLQNELIRIKYSLPGEFMLYTGGIEARKNIHLLINGIRQARRRNPAIPQLIITGISWDKYAGEFRELLEGEDIIVLPYLPYEEIVALYRLAILVVNTSTYEGFGMPVLEAITVQAPMLCSDIPAYREIGRENAYYFRNDDQADFVQQLDAFFSGSLPALEPLAMQKQALFFNNRNYAGAFFNMINHTS